MITVEPSTNVQPATKPPTSILIHYVLDGRAGKMDIPVDGLLLLQKLRRNLEPLSYTDSAKTKKRQTRTRYVIASFGPVCAWGYFKQSLVKNQKQVFQVQTVLLAIWQETMHALSGFYANDRRIFSTQFRRIRRRYRHCFGSRILGGLL